MKRRFSALCAIPAMFLTLGASGVILSGCGGGSTGSSTAARSNGRGQAEVRVQWPDRSNSSASVSRSVPADANSVRVSFLANTQNGGAGIEIATQLLVRPAGAAPVTRVVFNDLPQSTLALQAIALPNSDGSGTPQARTSNEVKIVAGETAPIDLALQSTIARVDILPADIALTVAPVTLTAIAYDSNGNPVPVSRWTWTNSDPNVLSFTASGNTATVAAGTAGTSLVTLTEAESGASISKRFTISAL